MFFILLDRQRHKGDSKCYKVCQVAFVYGAFIEKAVWFSLLLVLIVQLAFRAVVGKPRKMS